MPQSQDDLDEYAERTFAHLGVLEGEAVTQVNYADELGPPPEPPARRRRPWIVRALFELACGLLWGFQWIWENAFNVAIVLGCTAWVGYWGTAWLFLVLDRMAP